MRQRTVVPRDSDGLCSAWRASPTVAVRPQPLTGRVLYRISADDEIYLVNRNWARFAERNGAPELSEGVIGRPIWHFIQGEEVRQLYQALFRRVRDHRREARFTMRCDAPDLKRWLRFSIRRLQRGSLELSSREFRVEPRPWLRLLEPEAERDERRWIRMCAWCTRIWDADKEIWSEVDEALAGQEIFNDPRPPRITHGVCAVCSREVLNDG